VIVKASSIVEPDRIQTRAKTRKILHLINGEHFAGAERVQDLLALSLPDFGYDVGFACLKPVRFPEVRQSVDSALFETEMRSKFDIRCVSRVVKLFEENQYSLLHAHTPRTLMIASLAARRLDCPLVYHVHSPVGRDSQRGFANRVNTLIERWGLRHVDRMICVSHSLANYMEGLGHVPEKIEVVSNGVPCMDPLPHPADPGSTWTLGTMALFRPRKGTEVLLDAMAILQQRGVPVRLRAVGPFETAAYEAEVMQRVANLGIENMIEWTGFQTDVNHQLQQMDLFVLPSLYGEGLPMVVLEAMANAVPVIASRVEGIPEAVRDGVDGLIFEPSNANQLADQLTNLVGNYRRWQTMSRNCLERQRDSLSDISMARGVASIYDGLFAESST
jgi:glycosyltransferase involved in cell wall biosynthesis